MCWKQFCKASAIQHGHWEDQADHLGGLVCKHKMQSMSDVILGNCVMASKLIMRQHADGTSRVNSAAALTPADFIV